MGIKLDELIEVLGTEEGISIQAFAILLRETLMEIREDLEHDKVRNIIKSSEVE